MLMVCVVVPAAIALVPVVLGVLEYVCMRVYVDSEYGPGM